MSEVPPFEMVFEALRGGRSPLPWQSRLARTVEEEGWPEEIGVPTGLGKTACIDIAVWSLARDAASEPRRVPTRLWYVVNRRMLVDAAADHGEAIAALLADPELLSRTWPEASAEHRGALVAVASALASISALGVTGGPLHTVRLRGGAELGARPPDPSQPTLVFSTVSMFASRWLFRGYGTSRSMAPVDAALAGLDALILVDEAHLASALVALADPLSECDPGDPGHVLPTGRERPRFVTLTATGDRRGRFDLDAVDAAHPIVRQRIDATKPVRLVETTRRDLAAELARQALEILADPARTSCLVFTNTPRRARQVAAALRTAGRQVVVATGQLREREAEEVRRRLLDPSVGVASGRGDRLAAREALFIVATQTLEVGADLDVDALVSEMAGARALTQRLGRLNRLGEQPQALAVLCHAADLTEPLYGEEPHHVWTRLLGVGSGISLSPGVIAETLGAPGDVPAAAAEPLPGLVWEWVKTSVPPRGEAPVERYFAPDDDDVARVSLCWRAHRQDPGIALDPPVSNWESVEVPIGQVRDALSDRSSSLQRLRRLAQDRASLEQFDVERLQPGDVVVLSSSDGLYDDLGFNPEATSPVLDAAILHAGVLPLALAVLANLVPGNDRLLGLVLELEDHAAMEGAVPEFDASWAERFVVELGEGVPRADISADEWNAFCSELIPAVLWPVGDVAYLKRRRTTRRAVAPVRADVFDQLSFDATSVTLDEHLGSVGEAARRIGEAVGLAAPLISAVDLAGRFHDLGKLDARFQLWLDPEHKHADPVAKSELRREQLESARIASGWPRGGRHELVSGQLLCSWLDGHRLDAGVDEELVVHLVLSHHGHARPSVPIVAAETLEVSAEISAEQVTIAADLSRPDWSQPARFRVLCERYGYWGLALLEAVVRQADQAASSAVVA